MKKLIIFLIIVGYSEIFEQKNLAQDNARIAEEKEKMALKHLNDIKTLSASHRSKNLIQEVHELWPALPKTIPLIDNPPLVLERFLTGTRISVGGVFRYCFE